MSQREPTTRFGMKRDTGKRADEDLLKVEWRRSSDYAKAKYELVMGMLAAAGLLAFGAVALWNEWEAQVLRSFMRESPSLAPVFATPTVSLSLFGGIVLMMGAYLRMGRARAGFTQREWVSEIAEDVQETVREADPEPSMSNLILINRTEMSGYHQLTIDQATKSFRHSQIAMYLGLTLVIACVLLVTVSSLDTGVKIAITALGAVTTAVAGYLTSTFLKVHAVSITQLNRFFEQPLVSSYLLSAERVAQQLQDTSREAALGRVVDQALRVAVTERDVAAVSGPKREKRLHHQQEPEPSSASVDDKS